MNDHIAGVELAAYVDGALTDGKRAELEAHFSHCPACLEALAEIIDIQRSRVKIPGDFLRQALGEKKAARKQVLPLRLVFEIAAAFLVVVFIGYFIVSNNRFWQAGNIRQEKTAATAVRPASQLPAEAVKTIPVPAGKVDPATDAEVKKKLVAESTMNAPVPAMPPGKKMEPAALVKDRKLMPTDENEVREQEQKLAEAAAQPLPAEADKTSDAEAFRSRSAAPVVGGVASPLAANGQSVLSTGKGGRMAAAAAEPRIRIEGDVLRTDLRNPEILDGWTWLAEGMTLELVIDQAGAVIAVSTVGKWGQALADSVEKAARQLIFSVSAKKSRRARISASGSLPN